MNINPISNNPIFSNAQVAGTQHKPLSEMEKKAELKSVAQELQRSDPPLSDTIRNSLEKIGDQIFGEDWMHGPEAPILHSDQNIQANMLGELL